MPVATKDPKLLATWTALLAAADGTKVVQSPFLQAPTSEPGAARTYGGGNETLDGIEIIIGREATTFSANILNHSQDTIKALKAMMCENVGVFLIDEFGNIGLQSDGESPIVDYYPTPIRSLFVADKSLGGLENPDMNGISWKFLPNWSDNLVVITPTDFNALQDLVTPEA